MQLHLVDKVHRPQYADLAERFVLDGDNLGTLMALGGVKEIIQVNEENTDNVFGVISPKSGIFNECPCRVLH